MQKKKNERLCFEVRLNVLIGWDNTAPSIDENSNYFSNYCIQNS